MDILELIYAAKLSRYSAEMSKQGIRVCFAENAFEKALPDLIHTYWHRLF